MKTLTIIRHAKSSWADSGLDDFDRTLNRRGKQDAPMMGQRLAERDVYPDLILSSPAKRADKTIKKIAKKIGYPREDIIFEEKMYLADVPELLKIIRSIENSVQHLMLCGHNPGVTEFSNYVSGERIDNMPTCGVAVIGFDINSWNDVDRNTGVLERFDYPKNE